MSNLYNQNIGINYKGILNLDTTINTPLDATLRAVTDGAGTSSLLNLSTEQVGVLRTVNLAAGATNPSLFNVAYTINNSGAQTGTLRGIFLNATETLLNGIIHNLMDLQVGGVSRFRVRSDGSVFATGGDFATNRLLSAQAIFQGQGSGAVLVSETTAFNRLQLGGTTSSFPSIKRNGSAIDFRLADDSGLANINCGILNVDSFALVVQGSSSYFQYNLAIGKSGAALASSILELSSTTKGFLMPRMTQAQILLIATPANGLQVYNTTLNQPCFFDGTIWSKVNHSPM